jgi:anti-sigma factor RsiW
MTITLDRKILDMFVDGELPPHEMDSLARLLALYPDWEAYVRKQERLRRLLRGRYLWSGRRSARHGRWESELLDYGTGSRAS